ncbi:MAG TPA: HigA family addiction module antitoxin [bacterium]|nr:HigA family addiction module antitoxin [bacterium]
MKHTKSLQIIPPGEILLEEFMKPNDVGINLLSREIGVPPNRISGIVNGKRTITADTALRLGKFFGVSPETWLTLQLDYDLRVAKRKTWSFNPGRTHHQGARPADLQFAWAQNPPMPFPIAS